ncbi:hypothetical protein N7E81_07450 [Reichenbachiella carrageenanivorans]|uniref:ATP-grasp domain-containing protein n=1 Tax=Reichenbachiella carrageenanivorans TaxID=2979869 RepID=A0ABY6D4A5_9BACT|nr:hypothetical protein [Reichenbachiella carrageenanivorans]UXX80933.1 hypothetical protein N7E81_07450 [Reichenbachiella carrageenanivorans]
MRKITVAPKGKTKNLQATKSITRKLNRSVTWAKITRWEFWPFSVFYFPIAFYWAWLTLKTRSLFFFTASNPTIEFGGMLGESKDKIFDLIPDQYLPKTYKLDPAVDLTSFGERMQLEGINYPFILKPDIGQRGWMVALIQDEAQLVDYLDCIEVDFLVQEYVPYTVELGVFYYRYPNCTHGTVSSVVIKEMLSVIGDGERTVEALMTDDVRTKMHRATLRQKNPDLLAYRPAHEEHVELNTIGNHCLGTTFLNGNYLINEQLNKVFDEVSHQIEGFYFGRYDLRCRSMEDLYQGKHFKIVELNGAGAEPAHIYQPGFSLIRAYKDIIHHLNVLAEISQLNYQKGVAYYSFAEGMKEIIKIRKYSKLEKK